MHIRSLELEDLPALAELCARPDVAPELDEVPGEAQLQSFVGASVALGAFDGAKLLGAAGMRANDRARLRHVARAWLASSPRDAPISQQLLAALCDLGRDWWNVDRIALDAPETLLPSAPSGFELEVNRQKAFERNGQLLPLRSYAWIRPGVSASTRAREFSPRVKGPLPSSFAIRPAEPEHAESYARILGEPEVTWATLQVPLTPVSAWRKRLATNDRASTLNFVALVNGEPVANFGLHRLLSPRRGHTWSLGMGVAAAWQGRGVGRAALELLLALADERKILRVELDVFADNTRAIELYEKFGFVREGIKRIDAFREAAYADGLVMARLR